MTTSAAHLLALVYASTAATDFDDAALADLLETSRRNNAVHDLTGVLVYRDGRFLQVLEGPRAAVQERMTVISTDPRHAGIRVLIEEDVEDRWFPEWTMGYEPVHVDVAASVPGYRATFDDLERDDDGPAAIRAVRALVGWFRERAAA